MELWTNKLKDLVGQRFNQRPSGDASARTAANPGGIGQLVDDAVQDQDSTRAAISHDRPDTALGHAGPDKKTGWAGFHYPGE